MVLCDRSRGLLRPGQYNTNRMIVCAAGFYLRTMCGIVRGAGSFGSHGLALVGCEKGGMLSVSCFLESELERGGERRQRM